MVRKNDNEPERTPAVPFSITQNFQENQDDIQNLTEIQMI